MVLFIMWMTSIKVLVSKILYSLKRTIKKIVPILTTFLALIGVILTLNELLKYIELHFIEDNIKNYPLPTLIILFFISFIKNWDKLCVKVPITGSPDISITLKVCNALNNKGALIIPTNTTFDTTMGDEFISKNSLQGQYQLRYYKNSLYELDKSIENGLNNKPYVVLNDGRTTKTKRYLIGTICRVNKNNKRVYFLADSDINPNGIPINVNIETISQSLVSLWESLVDVGNQEPYSIPLIGTGKAGINDASRDEIVRDIVLSFLAATRNHKITEDLIICIHPNDFDKVNWDEFIEFINYQCKYANKKENNKKFFSKDFDTSTCDAINSPKHIPNSVPSNITETESLLLMLLTGNKMNVSQIAASLGTTRAHATMISKKLVEKGLIQCIKSGKETLYYVVSDNE